MSKPGKAMRWPYGIALSFVLIIALIIGTIIVASNNKVEPSDLYMSNYHHIDQNNNQIVMEQIAFNKKYTIEYVTEKLDVNGTVISYVIADKRGHAVNDADVMVVITRPNTHQYDINLESPIIENGRYTFDSVTLPKEGRWDIMAHVKIGDYQRYYNLKADTRYSQTYEY